MTMQNLALNMGGCFHWLRLSFVLVIHVLKPYLSLAFPAASKRYPLRRRRRRGGRGPLLSPPIYQPGVGKVGITGDWGLIILCSSAPLVR